MARKFGVAAVSLLPTILLMHLFPLNANHAKLDYLCFVVFQDKKPNETKNDEGEPISRNQNLSWANHRDIRTLLIGQ